MKIGLILECGPKGPDLPVYKYLAGRILSDANLAAEFSFSTLENKPKLLQQCGDAASVQISQGCDRILIIWDLYPAWREHGKTPCLYADRERIFHSLTAAGVDIERVALICVQEELEAWLLADGDVLTEFLKSLNSHAGNVKHHKTPERIGVNPKTTLNKLMLEQTRRRYEDYVHAPKIAARITDLTRLRKACPIFRRFEQKVLGK